MTSWTEHAACLGADADLFFVDEGNDVRPAKRICAACPVRAECLERALADNERFGVWGGTTPRERRPLRRAWLAKQAAPAPVVVAKRAKVGNGRVMCGTFSGYVTHRKVGQEACDACKAAAAAYKRRLRAKEPRYVGGLPAGSEPPRVAHLIAPPPPSSTVDYDPAGVLDRPWFGSVA